MAKQLPSKLKKRIKAAQEWLQYKANGKYIDRCPVGQEPTPTELKDNSCLVCFAPKDSYHVHGCPEQFLLCCGKLTWNCICEAELDDYN
jgi:hypothetical protein